MHTNTGKRTAKVRTTLTKRIIEALEPTDTSWIAWDDKLGKRRRCCVTRPRSFRRALQVPDEHTPLAPFLQTYAGPTEAPRPEARRPPRNTFMRLMAERTRSNA